jgi:ribosomal protein S18 acetylase RimI-like enzyme
MELLHLIYINSLENICPEMLQGFFVGWPTHPNPETHFKMLHNSYKVILAVDEDKNKVIGFISAISDGVLSAYIPLLEVLPEYQNLGIGKELVHRMLKELEEIYMVDLMCDENLQPYYEKMDMLRANGMVIRNYKMQAGK